MRSQLQAPATTLAGGTGIVLASGRGTVDLAHGRIASIEGLRGLAFLVVHFFHAMNFGPMPGTFRLRGVYEFSVDQGWAGVDLFFMLSGFLITGTLFRTLDDRNWLGRFYLRRALRILPLYYMVLFGTLFLIPAVFRWTAPVAEVPRENLAWYMTFTHNWLNLRLNGWPQGDHLIGQLWSLGVEEQFYLVWPLAVALLRPAKLGILAVGLLFAAPAVRYFLSSQGYRQDAIYALTLCRADDLAAGALIAILATANRLPSPRTAWFIAAGGGALFFAVSWLASRLGAGAVSDHLRNSIFTWALVMWSGLLIAALRRGVFARLLSFKPLRFVGFYSYTLYLVSYPLCFVAGSYWKAWFSNQSTLGHILFTTGTLGVSILIAMASWHLVEKRFLSFHGTAPVFR